MSNIIKKDGETINVQELIDKYKSLGIPHFQRGQVWSEENISNLFESLYYDTPCGAIILWKNSDLNHGQPPKGEKQFEYLIVDGQQRIRGVYEALENVNEDKIWCVNLYKVKELEKYIKPSEKYKKSKLFIKINNPVKNYKFFLENKKERLPGYQFNFIPLHYFFNKTEFNEKDCFLQSETRSREKINKRIIFIKLKEENNLREFLKILNKEKIKIRNINKRSLFLRILENSKIEEVIQIYNRINSAGLRVQAEEKAFATLTSFYPETHERIKKLFDEVHEKDSGEDRGYLKRMKERNFGFKLFIRIFILTANYHLGCSPGSGSLNFDMVKNYGKEIKEKDEWEKLWDETEKNIKYIRQLLKDELRCDDLRFLPETLSLMPIFQVLIKYPEIKKYPKTISKLILEMYLAKEMTQREIFQIVLSIFKQEEIRIKEISKEVNGDKMLERLKDSNSLRDRYTLLLYWLIRKNEARDFNYEENAVKLKNSKEETKINEACSPEKEHLIPYNVLKRIYGLSGARINKHKINNIGNITYISVELNNFDVGKGGNFLELEMEGQDNLNAHFLQFEKYEKTKNFSASHGKEVAKKEFEKFCEERRKQIIYGFIKWVREIEEKINQNEIDKINELVSREPKFKKNKKEAKEPSMNQEFLIESSEAKQRTSTKVSSKRKPPLSRRELEGVAEDNKVGNFYRKIANGLSGYFDSTGTTLSSMYFAHVENNSKKTIFSICPSESNEKQGIKYKMYTDRLTDYFEVKKESIVNIFPTYKKVKDGDGGEHGEGYIENDEQAEEIISLLADKKNKN